MLFHGRFPRLLGNTGSSYTVTPIFHAVRLLVTVIPQANQLPAYTSCSGSDCSCGAECSCKDPGSRGDCHLGDKCLQGVCKTDFYSGASTHPSELEPPRGPIECRPKNGCCDDPEVCAGALNCPQDVFASPSVVCRPPCAESICSSDITEACTGGGRDCPADVVLDADLCIIAGNPKNQVTQVGSVELTAALLLTGATEFCYKIVNSGYSEVHLQFVQVTPFSSSSPPLSSAPGQMKNGGVVPALEGCITLPSTCGTTSPPTSLVFAIHFAMNSGQTAWAVNCNGSADPTGLTGYRFVNKKSGSYEGWGKYWVYTPCCKIGCAETCK